MPSTQTFATVTSWGQQRINPSATPALSSLPNPLSLDLVQVYGEGGDLLLNVTSTGIVHNPGSGGTTQCLFGRYYSRLTGSPSTAAIFADVFSQNNAQQDVLQVIAPGNAPIFHLDYLGVAYSDSISLTPSHAAIGATVVIAGKGFGASQGGSTITFNGAAVVTYNSWSDTSISVVVPTATTGAVLITVGTTVINAGTFTVNATPHISSLSETTGSIGDAFTITGTGFGATQGTGTAKVNGTPFVIGTWSDTSIVTVIPTATTGAVIVHQNGVDSNSVTLTIS